MRLFPSYPKAGLMPLETATYIDQLVTSNPVDTDNEGQGAAHLRLLKAVLQAQFPSLGNAAVTVTAAVLNLLSVNSAGTALRTNGTIPVGSMHWFPLDPGTTLLARGGTATGNEQFVECDGSTYATSKFPDLAASGMVSVSAPNFTMPNLSDTGRYVRARTGSVVAGTSQSNQNAAHTHTITDPGHTHTVTDPGHNHAITDPGHTHSIAAQLQLAGSGNVAYTINSGRSASPTTDSATTGITINSHTTGVTNVSNTTGITATNSTGGTEARPESYVAVCCLKA